MEELHECLFIMFLKKVDRKPKLITLVMNKESHSITLKFLKTGKKIVFAILLNLETDSPNFSNLDQTKNLEIIKNKDKTIARL